MCGELFLVHGCVLAVLTVAYFLHRVLMWPDINAVVSQP